MTIYVWLIAIFYSLWWKFNPKIEYIRQSKMWICHYNNGKQSRDWFIIFKEK